VSLDNLISLFAAYRVVFANIYGDVYG